ncbi:MAG: hypothetical protein WCX73_00685 [Candidatus Pacearchaeota archaeon]|jgi:hypothetical protein
MFNWISELFDIQEEKFLNVFINLLLVNLILSIICFLIAPDKLTILYGKFNPHPIQLSRFHLLWFSLTVQIISLTTLSLKDKSQFKKNSLISNIYIFVSFFSGCILVIPLIVLIFQYVNLNNYNPFIVLFTIILILAVYTGILLSYLKRKLG